MDFCLHFGHFGGLHLECAGLTALCVPAALTQAPTADASKNSQQAFHCISKISHYEPCASRTEETFRSSFGGAVKPAPMKATSSRRTPRSRDRCSWLKNVQAPMHGTAV